MDSSQEDEFDFTSPEEKLERRKPSDFQSTDTTEYSSKINVVKILYCVA